MLLTADAATRNLAFTVIEAAVSASGPVAGEVKLRLEQMRETFTVEEPAAVEEPVAVEAPVEVEAPKVRRGRTGRTLKVVQ